MELLRLLYILAHRQTVNFFDILGQVPSNEAFTWRLAECFFHNRAAIGIACAQATPIRTHVAHYYLFILLQLKKGGVAKAEGEREKEKECTTECKSRRR